MWLGESQSLGGSGSDSACAASAVAFSPASLPGSCGAVTCAMRALCLPPGTPWRSAATPQGDLWQRSAQAGTDTLEICPLYLHPRGVHSMYNTTL